MQGITPVIAVILLLLITISMVGFAFVFLGRTTETAAESGEQQLEQQIKQISGRLLIDNIGQGFVYVRNIGSTDLSSITVYVNNKAVNFATNKPILKPNEIAEIELLEGASAGEATVRVVSSNSDTQKMSMPKILFVCDSPVGSESTCDALFNYVGGLNFAIDRINGPVTSLSQFSGYDIVIDDSYAWSVNARGDSASTLWQHYQNGGRILLFGNDNGGPDVTLVNNEGSCSDEITVLRNVQHRVLRSVGGQVLVTGGDWHRDTEAKNSGETILGDMTNCPGANANDPGLVALEGSGKIVSAIAVFNNNPVEQTMVRNSIWWLTA